MSTAPLLGPTSPTFFSTQLLKIFSMSLNFSAHPGDWFNAKMIKFVVLILLCFPVLATLIVSGSGGIF